jgi:hypothetical protein
MRTPRQGGSEGVPRLTHQRLIRERRGALSDVPVWRKGEHEAGENATRPLRFTLTAQQKAVFDDRVRRP